MNAITTERGPPVFPRRDDFAPMHVTYLDAGYTHPLSLGARAASERYLEYRMRGPTAGGYDVAAVREAVPAQFAQLIGAAADEVSLIGSTMEGENLILSALGLQGGRGRIVTDALHFFGSLYLYEMLRARGVDVVVVKPRGQAIEMEDLAAALERPTDLVAVSLVSNYNGFRHDLRGLCNLAHARGALVYADIIQAAGAVPFDVADTDVDFCACATFKWLMGDYGVAFLYARRALMERLDVSAFGYRQLAHISAEPAGDPPVHWVRRTDATGAFAVGTIAHGALAQLHHSLDYIKSLGVERIAAYRGQLLARLRAGLAERRIPVLTPLGRETPLLAFSPKDISAAVQRLAERKVFVTSHANRVRVSPSMYNDEGDIERLLDALDPYVR